MNNRNKTSGYLYHLKDDKLIVEEGNAVTSIRGYNMFVISNNKRISICRESWRVYNNFIWCPADERDDLRAVNILFDYENRMVEELKTRVTKHNTRAHALAGILSRMHDKEELKKKLK